LTAHPSSVNQTGQSSAGNRVQAKFGMVAGWEAATDAKLQHSAVMREYGKLEVERAAALDARREALATKLYEEESLLQHELLTNRTTPEEKRAALAVRAKGLWEAREAERQAAANALLERHFRCALARCSGRLDSCFACPPTRLVQCALAAASSSLCQQQFMPCWPPTARMRGVSGCLLVVAVATCSWPWPWVHICVPPAVARVNSVALYCSSSPVRPDRKVALVGRH
jgi:hypothetical protein